MREENVARFIDLHANAFISPRHFQYSDDIFGAGKAETDISLLDGGFRRIRMDFTPRSNGITGQDYISDPKNWV